MLPLAAQALWALLLYALLPSPTARRIRAGRSERGILLDIEESLGRWKGEAIRARAFEMEEALRHSFEALPKNSHGRVGPAVSNYALHRLFLQVHSWQMKDLQPVAGAWHEHSPTAALKRGPSQLHDTFQNKLDKHGLDLHELSVMAAAIEQLVRDEADVLLNVSFQSALGFVPAFAQSLEASAAQQVMERYMSSYILGTESSLRAEDLQELHQNIGSYPRWPEVRELLREATAEVAGGADHLSFHTMSSILLLTSDRFARLEEKECQALKRQLVDMEERPGRVLLRDFYRPALNQGTLEFTESADFLRQQGALDETDREARVIVPNYMMADSNCLASSEYYAVCCADPCEEIMDQLEASLRAPSASPTDLLDAVSVLADGLGGLGGLSPELSERLQEVATHHDGEVPLHGRLFAQWLHHAFPRDCPFPHVSGTVRQSLAQFQEERHERAAFAEYKEMQEIVNLQSWNETWNATHIADVGSMWLEDEELIDPESIRGAHSQRTSFPMFMKFAHFALSLVTVAAGLLKLCRCQGSIYHQKMV